MGLKLVTLVNLPSIGGFKLTGSRPSPSLLTLVFSLLFLPSYSSAQIFENLFTGNAKAMALGNAVTADPPGVYSFLYNPAGLTRLKHEGSMTQVSFLGATIDSSFSLFPNSDAYSDSVVRVDDCVNECLFGADFTTIQVNDVEPDGSAIFVPGYGLIERDNGPAVMPSAAFAYRPKDSKFVFATGPSVALLFGTRFDQDKERDFFLPQNLLAISAFNLIQPTFGYEINDQWSIGASIGIQALGVALSRNVRFADPFVGAINVIFSDIVCPNDFLGDACPEEGGNFIDPLESLVTFSAEAEDLFTPYFTLGVLWEPSPWLSWGMLYRSEVRHKLKGIATVQYSDRVIAIINSGLLQVLPRFAGAMPLDEGVSSEDVDAKIDATLPAHLAMGVSLRVTSALKFNFDLKWTGYSSLGDLDADLSGDTTATSILPVYRVPINGLDMVNRSFGFEYLWNDRLTLRAGYENRPRSVDRGGLFDGSVGGIRLRTLGISYLLRSGLVADFTVATLQSQDFDAFIPHDTSSGSIAQANLDTVGEIKGLMVFASWHKNY